ncbi:MAG: class I SAM-dependent methyltransferase [Planctomycetota bacterium]
MGLADALRSALAHPLTRGMDLDDPATTGLRRRIIREKPFLKAIYDDWYAALGAAVPDRPEPALELGSGGGFFAETLPNCITSEVFACGGVDLICDATRLPMPDAALRAVVMVDVLHHVPNIPAVLRESARCVAPGGVVAMIEPWNTAWSRLVYRNLHHEPFEPSAQDWALPPGGPLSGANGALPWIVFQRDRGRFEREHGDQWSLRTVRPFMPMRYLISGGVAMRTLMPGWMNGPARLAEAVAQPLANQLGMFALIVLERRAA